MADTSVPTKDPEIEVVYLGQRSLSDPTKSAALFITPARLEASSKANVEQNASLYSAAKVGRLIVGALYKSTGTLGSNGSVSTLALGKLTFVRRLDRAEVADWELNDSATRANMRAVAQERKIKASPVLMDEIRGLRRTYALAAPSIRPAIELAVLKLIRGA